MMGCLAVGLTYRLAVRAFNDKMIGLIASFMLALSAFHIYYSQEARFYALSAVMGVLLLLLFFRALESGSARDWTLYAIAACAALYSHYFLAIVLLVQAAYVTGACLLELIRHPDSTSRRSALYPVFSCAAAQIVAVALFIPWLVYALPRQLQGGWPPLPKFGLRRLHNIFVVLIGLAPMNSAQSEYVSQVVRADLVLGLALVGLISSLVLRRMRALVLAGIVIIAVPLAWFADKIGHYFWSERQVILVLVPLYLLAAAGAQSLLVGAGKVAAVALSRRWFRLDDGAWR